MEDTSIKKGFEASLRNLFIDDPVVSGLLHCFRIELGERKFEGLHYAFHVTRL